MMTLTARQQHVLDLLEAYQRDHGFPPTNFEKGRVEITISKYEPAGAAA